MYCTPCFVLWEYRFPVTDDDVTATDVVAGSELGRVVSASALDELPLQASPIISQDDILTYDGDSHVFTLAPAAMERLAGWALPIAGSPFVVTVDGRPIYAGAFWTPLSSLSFDGVVLLTGPDGSPFGDDFRIELGYPGPDFFNGEDPRGDPRILAALDAGGKLR